MNTIKTELKKHSYAVTFVLPSFKKVNFEKQYKPYVSFSQEKQKSILRSNFENGVGLHTNADSTYSASCFFELHEDKRYHLHTYIEDITEETMLKIQKSICENLGFKEKQFMKVLDFFIPDKWEGWLNYINKDNIDDLKRDLQNFK